MIARLSFDWAGIACIAELTDDLHWICRAQPGATADESAIANHVGGYLSILFDPRDNLTPSRGMPGYAEVEAAATFLEATVEGLRQPGREGDDRLY